jgi:hypothetical protein
MELLRDPAPSATDKEAVELLDERSFLLSLFLPFSLIDIEHSVHVIPITLIFFSHHYPALFSFLMYT